VLCALLRTRRAILSGCLLLVAAGPFARFTGATNFEKLYGYFSCFDLIALGCASAIIHAIVAKETVRPTLSLGLSGAGLGLSIYVMVAMPIPENITWGPSLLGIGIALLLGLTGCQHRCGSLLATLSWPLQILGKRSYEIYLFHGIILLLLVNYLKSQDFDLVPWSPLFLPLFILTCAVIGEVIGKSWSEPANRFIRRLSFGAIFQPRMDAN
jgi:peptidoglycan/LPS O-acetylase OafA/YrhL